MSCITTIEGKGQLSAHINNRYIPCTPESKLGYIAPRPFLMGAKLFIRTP